MLLIASWVLFVCLVVLAIITVVAISQGALTLESVCYLLVYISAATIVGYPLIHG